MTKQLITKNFLPQSLIYNVLDKKGPCDHPYFNQDDYNSCITEHYGVSHSRFEKTYHVPCVYIGGSGHLIYGLSESSGGFPIIDIQNPIKFSFEGTASKVGQSNDMGAIYRGRNQSGSSWGFGALLHTQDSRMLEKLVSIAAKNYHIGKDLVSDNQQELYAFTGARAPIDFLAVVLADPDVANLVTDVTKFYKK